MGIRAEEFNPRALLTPLILNRSLSTQQRTVYNWLSIFDLTLSDLPARHWVHPIRLHPVYIPSTKGWNDLWTLAPSVVPCLYLCNGRRSYGHFIA